MIVAREGLERRRYLDQARGKLAAIASALRLPKGGGDVLCAAWRRVVGPFADIDVRDTAPWPSGISDDASPFEFSLVLDAAEPELRVLWESQGAGGHLQAKMDAALQSHRRLHVAERASTRRFDQIADLFLPSEPQGGFVLWHAARLWPLGDPELKAYLNPQVRGPERAAELVQEALARLGLSASWRYVQDAMSRGPGLDEIRYFSLDLRDGGAPRVKVYVYHHETTPDVLARVAALSPAAQPERVVEFYARVSGGREPAAGFSPGSCLSFVADRGPAPTAITLHVPVRAYVDDDAEACERVASLAAPAPDATRGEHPLLAASGVDLHHRVARGIAQRPLERGVGLTTYVSLRSQRDAERVTCYLATELFAVHPPRRP
jgi:DMATS type aromatic prenyltransferase